MFINLHIISTLINASCSKSLVSLQTGLLVSSWNFESINQSIAGIFIAPLQNMDGAPYRTFKVIWLSSQRNNTKDCGYRYINPLSLIAVSVLIDFAGHYLFRELCQSWHSVYHSRPPIRKCNRPNERDPQELPDFWPPYSLDLNTVVNKNLWQRIYQTNTQNVNNLRQHLIDVGVGV